MEDSKHIAPVHVMLRDARRAAGMTQSALASAVSCKQSAISMMERGRVDALAQGTLENIAEMLGVDLPDQAKPSVLQDLTVISAGAYCPTFDCPSNLPYMVGGEIFFAPSSSGGSKHCSYCGELVESRCPGCGAVVESGACCLVCGTAYVSSEGLGLPDPQRWADEQRARIREIRGL